MVRDTVRAGVEHRVGGRGLRQHGLSRLDGRGRHRVIGWSSPCAAEADVDESVVVVGSVRRRRGRGLADGVAGPGEPHGVDGLTRGGKVSPTTAGTSEASPKQPDQMIPIRVPGGTTAPGLRGDGTDAQVRGLAGDGQRGHHALAGQRALVARRVQRDTGEPGGTQRGTGGGDLRGRSRWGRRPRCVGG